jgi:hypothetical protein
MSSTPTFVEKHIQLSAERADHLNRLAQIHQVDEDQIIEKALDILFTLTDLLSEDTERQGWSFLSDAALQRVWDNKADAAYYNWRSLYNVPARWTWHKWRTGCAVLWRCRIIGPGFR